MEERKVRLCKRQVVVGRHELEELPQLLNQGELQLLRLKPKEVPMLNCMLYFVIFVTEKMQHSTFEHHVRQRLSQLYLENRMRVRLSELSRATASVLHADLNECIHILYYLVYGRFASVGYVNMIAQNQERTKALKKMTMLIPPNLPEAETPLAELATPKFDKKISWKLGVGCSQNDLDSFSHELEAMLRTKKTHLRLDLQQNEEQAYNSHSELSSLGVKLHRVKNRQTSPLMNILRSQAHTSVESLRVNRRILDSTKATLSKTFMSASKRERLPMPSIEKPQKEKISLKAVLDIRQKLKSENAFLDELRRSLMSNSVTPSRKRHHDVRSHTSYGHPLTEIHNTQPSLHQTKPKLETPSSYCLPQPKIPTEQRQPTQERQPTNHPTESDPGEFHQTQNIKQTPNNDIYKFLAENKKPPVRLKLTFYKKKFNEFLRGQQDRSSLLM